MKYGKEKALTLCTVRQKTIYRKIFTSKQVSGNVPRCRSIYRKYLCTEFITHPADIFFIFLRIIRASAIDKQSTGFQTGPYIGDDTSLTLPADFHILRTPFADGNGIFTEHTFTGTGNIGQYDIEEAFQISKVCRIVIGYHDTGMPPLRQILRQDLRTVTDHFICYQQAACRQYTAGMGRFSTGSGAKVKHHGRRFTDILL